MASVSVDSGPMAYFYEPDDVPKEKWRDLMWVKRDHINTRIKADCRSLLKFVEEANLMWEALGFTDAEDMIRHGYELDPQEVEYALTWLRLKAPDEAVTYEVAVSEGRKLLTRQEAGAKGGRGNKAGSETTSFIGRGKAYQLARLERDAPDILEALNAGEYKSVRQAAIAAGIVKQTVTITGNDYFDVSMKAVEKLSPDEKEMLIKTLSNSV